MNKQPESLLTSLTKAPDIPAEAAKSLIRVLKIETVADLAESPHFGFAAELVNAAADSGHPLQRFGIPHDRIDRAFEGEPIKALGDAPLNALDGIGKQNAARLSSALGVDTLRELALWPPFVHARALFAEAVRNGVVSAAPRIFRVTGSVVRADGSAVADAKVRLGRRTIREIKTLGGRDAVTTNADGRFIFEYARPESSIDLYIELTADPGNGIADTRPRVIAGAGADERVDFVVGDEAFRGLSTFERLLRTIGQALADERIEPPAIADFDPQSLARLSLTTGIVPQTLVLLRHAFEHARETGLPAEMFFGIGREKGSIVSLSAVLVQDPEKRRTALAAAIKANQIPTRITDEVTKALIKLDELSVEEALKIPAAANLSSVGSVLEAAGIPATKHRKLADTYIRHTGEIEEFWKAVHVNGDLTDAEIGRVQFELQLSVATLNHVPLNTRLKAGGVGKLEDLAKFDTEQLLGLIEGSGGARGAGLPADLAAAGITQQGYAALIYRVIEDAIPTAIVAHRVDNFPNARGIAAFLGNNPDFNLRSVPMRSYLERNPTALDFAADPVEREAITRGMKGLERSYRVSPPGARVETMQLLLNDGLDSAGKICTLGRAEFMRRHEKTLGREQAGRVFRRARNAAATAEIVAARYNDPTAMYVLPNQNDSLKGSSFAEMFGSPDFCSCAHCQSVFSPAAYLVETLHWLDQRRSNIPVISGEPPPALDVLLVERRADIAGIELSCANTNTPLPYIDIVNEVLELLVAPPDEPASYQTSGAAADLRAHPQHQHDPAYAVIACAKASHPPPGSNDAVFPFNLPFNLWLEEARVYLGQLGVPRYRLMETLQGVDAARSDLGMAIENLGMSPLEWDIITDQAQPSRTVEALWGLGGDADFLITLANVSLLLEQATPPIAAHGMEFSELADLLRTDFIQTPVPLQVVFAGSVCDTGKSTLVGLDEDHLERMHRFIRLNRRLGWSALDLDRAIAILGDGNLDDACLRAIAGLRRLSDDLALPVAELLSWWGALDTRRWNNRLIEDLLIEDQKPAGFSLTFDNEIVQPLERDEEASPYERLFQNASVEVVPAGAFDVNADGSELNISAILGDHHITPIAGALGITVEQLTELLPRLPRDIEQIDLNLANLSALYAHVSLARALELSIRELIGVLDLTGIDPFVATDTGPALDLVERVAFIRKSGFSIDELNYLLRHVDTKPATMEPDATDIGVLLFELGAALRVADAQYPAPVELAAEVELREQLIPLLGVVLEPADVNEAMAFINIDPQDNQSPAATAAQFIDDKLATVLDADQAKARLVTETAPAYLDQRRARLDYVTDALAAHLRQAATAAVVIERMAAAVDLEPSVCAVLMRDRLVDPSNSSRSLLAVFADAAVRDYARTEDGSDQPILPDATDLPAQFAAYTLLRKVGIILDRLRIDKNDLGWVLARGPTRGTLDLQSLPLTADAANAPFDGWQRLRESVALRDGFSPRAVFDLFETAAVSQAGDTSYEALLTELERRSRWDREDIEFLVGSPARAGEPAQPGALGFAYPGDWQDEQPLQRLAEVMTVVRRIGLAASTIWEWRLLPIPDDTTPGPEQSAIDRQQAQASQIKQAVRARYGEQQWIEIAPKLRDRLREQQRDALVGWLVGTDSHFGDAGALFEYLLLDVEMSPCQLTSRIKQANSSVQLFMQRLLLGLEVDDSEPAQPLVELSRGDAEEWAWRKNYRVWEANRKVFLYPENWLEPNLRDDKTPFFAELENELLQNEVTTESAETAMRGYLQKLDEVARLEIVGLCEQKDDGADILHVFGRTRGIPPTYYYRQRIDRTRWTPWEKIEVGIEGNHLIPVVFNRRLYLFWAIIAETALEEEPDAIQAPPSPQPSSALRYYEIRLAWSQRQANSWSTKKIAADFIGQNVTSGQGARIPGPEIKIDDSSSPAAFFFRARLSGGDLFIDPFRFRDRDGTPNIQFARPGEGLPGNSGDTFCRGLVAVDDGKEELGETKNFRLPRFRMSGCDGTVTVEPRAETSNTNIKLPPHTFNANQTFTRLSGGGTLAFPAPDGAASVLAPTKALASPKSPFAVVPLRMDDFRSAGPFFYQDRQRTFFIEPYSYGTSGGRVPEWENVSFLALEPVRMIPGLGGRPQLPEIDPWLYDPGATASQPPNITVSVPPTNAGASSGLASRSGLSLAASLGPRVALVSNAAVESRSTRMAFSMAARIVDANGQMLEQYCPGGPTPVARALSRTEVRSTYALPNLEGEAVMITPMLRSWRGTTYRFDVFYHPYLCTMMRALNRFGLDGLLNPSPSEIAADLQPRQANTDSSFFDDYGPENAVLEPKPVDEFEFRYGGAYSQYNWEVFFHVPFTIACQLSQNQRFAEAQKWFHYFFDPTETTGLVPQRFWKVKPLFELFNDDTVNTGPMAELLLLLQYDGANPGKLRRRDELNEQIAAWRADPFRPHALARLRLMVYARSVVMKYLDNLIDWGDQLFRRDSMESINEATQLYTLAAQILGRRPREVEREPRKPHTFARLREGADAFGNALVEEIEGLLPEPSETEADVYQDDGAVMSGTLFFCIPPNDKLLSEYWGRVADRLFKIRHCMNIEGTVRQLALFEPPIDPGLLVRAKAAGIDLASALSDWNAPLPCYRFQLLSQKATELCADVRGLGQALLSAMEKKDAEQLAQIRAGHQSRLEQALIDVREKQLDEAKEALAALHKSKENAEIRRGYYRSRPYMNLAEIAQLSLSATAGLLDATAQGVQALGSILANAPDTVSGGAGFGGSPMVTLSFGGAQFSYSTKALSSSLQINAGIADRLGGLSGIIGGYERRSDDWGLQGDTAEKEIEALEHQILGAEIRVEIAEKERDNLKLQLEQSEQTEAFLRDKYTNVQLYQWMVGQLSSLHFQSYQLAFDLAKRAERAWQFQLPAEDKGFIQFGYWDSLKKGLLAGERLHHDLKRMEVAHLEANKREYELVRHVSLRELDAVALLRLRRDGECFVEVPEAWFDLATPGHYLRRIKTVALSIPCVTGPYAAVSCTLTLVSNKIRISPNLSGGYERTDDNDARFRDDLVGLQSIVTSQAQQDSGLFETNLRDERYLPFEGAGAISRWRLELPKKFRQFDYETISDVILHIRYTARDGGALLRDAAEQHLGALIEVAQAGGQVRLFSARHEFPTEWAAFLSQTPSPNQRFELSLDLRPEHYPFWSQGRLNKVERVDVFAQSSEDTIPPSMEIFETADNNDPETKGRLTKDPALGNLLKGELTSGLPATPDGEMKMFMETNRISALWIAVTWSEAA